MNQAGVNGELLAGPLGALLKEETTGGPVGAMVLPDGSVVTERRRRFWARRRRS